MVREMGSESQNLRIWCMTEANDLYHGKAQKSVFGLVKGRTYSPKVFLLGFWQQM